DRNVTGVQTCALPISTYITNLSRQEESISKLAGELREVFAKKQLKAFELVKIEDKAPAITEIETILEFASEENKQILDNRVFRLIYQDKQNTPLIRGYHNGEWKLLFNFYDIEYLEYK